MTGIRLLGMLGEVLRGKCANVQSTASQRQTCRRAATHVGGTNESRAVDCQWHHREACSSEHNAGTEFRAPWTAEYAATRSRSVWPDRQLSPTDSSGPAKPPHDYVTSAVKCNLRLHDLNPTLSSLKMLQFATTILVMRLQPAKLRSHHTVRRWLLHKDLKPSHGCATCLQPSLRWATEQNRREHRSRHLACNCANTQLGCQGDSG